MVNITLVDDPLKIIISCAICRKGEAAIFQAEGDYCVNCWQEMTHPKI